MKISSEVTPERRSPCPVACTLDLIGDKWTLLVIRDLYLGKKMFREFRQSPEGIASNILTDRLRKLTSTGVVETTPSKHKSDAVEYSLSEVGQSLLPILKAVADWGDAHLEGVYFGLGRGPADS
ncbi:MAG: helix-turn-helix domain-containing protein [Verrucomicrobiota bacterium]